MRKTLLTLSLMCLACFSQSQQNLPVFNYTPQAPAIANFTRYGDIPVDLSTGLTSISIPIYNLSENGINVPVSISYHASGIKVNDAASSVGLGWTLNAGGTLTRTVFGTEDEFVDFGNKMRPQWSSAEELDAYAFAREITDPYVWYRELYHYHFFTTDKYTDRFYYSLSNGESGIFRKDLATNVFKTIPYKPIKIRFISSGSIEMIAADGVRYIFRKSLRDFWYPEKIINSSGTDSVVFYSHVGFVSNNQFNCTQVFGSYKNHFPPKTEPVIEGSDPCWYHVNIRDRNISEGVNHNWSNGGEEIALIDSIVSTNTVIRFNYAQDREDAIYAFSARLTNIQVLNKLSGALIKNVNFSHTYTGSTDPFNPYMSSRRLMLAGMQSGANGEEKHAFKYDDQALPWYQGGIQNTPSYGMDLWGYNGRAGSALLFADFAPGGNNGLFPEEDMTKACMLEEIKYPTGGKTVFEYENHRVPLNFYGYGLSPAVKPADGKVGGLRIKKISSFAYEGATPSIKSYEYECELVPEYGRIDQNKFTYTQETFNYYNTYASYANCGYIGGYASWGISSANICTSNPMGPIIGMPQAPVYYSKVTEYNGVPGSSAGKTVYYYEMPDHTLWQESEDPRWDGPWQTDVGSYIPPLSKKEEYKLENGQYKLVRKTETLFTKLHDSAFVTGLNLASDLDFVMLNISWPHSHAFDYYNEVLHEYLGETLHYSNTKAYTALKLPSKTSVYDYVDNNNYVLTSTDYSYNNYGQQIAATTTTSKGELLKTKFTYPVDYPGQAPYTTMVARNNIAPVIEQSIYKSTTTPEVFLQSAKTNFNYWDPASQSWGNSTSSFILPQTVETKKGTADVETRVRYFSYDVKGNPVYVAKENDTRQIYFWGYNNTYAIANVVNVADDQKPYVSYTSFEDVISLPTLSGLIIDDNTAPTGKKCLLVRPGGLNYSLNSNYAWILSYWYKTGSSINVSGNSTILSTSPPHNGWLYVKRRITGTSSITINGTGSLIDEIRLYPETAQMTTFTYEPQIGLTAQCDANDRITYYQYDAAGRLILVKDDNGNVLKKICYNFQGQPDVCGESAIALWQPTGAVRCKPCPQNSIYITNIRQQEERDNNPNSDTYGNIRWVDLWVYADCVIQPGWTNTANTRCVTINNQNTGEQQQEQSDRNPCSSTYGQTRWISAGTNTTVCPVPSVYRSLPIVNKVYYKQNCGAQQNPLPYTVNLPEGAFTSPNSAQEANALAEQEAQRFANVNGGCYTVYVRAVTELMSDPASDQQYSNITFNFYSDAAGTVPLTLPTEISVNYKVHDWWTVNGVPDSDGYTTGYSWPGGAGYSSFSMEYTSKFCHDGTTCYHNEYIIEPGRYIIIP